MKFEVFWVRMCHSLIKPDFPFKKKKKKESCELSEETSAMSQFVFGRIHTSSGRPWGSINTMEGNCTFSDNNFVIWEYFPTFTSLFSLPVMHYL